MAEEQAKQMIAIEETTESAENVENIETTEEIVENKEENINEMEM